MQPTETAVHGPPCVQRIAEVVTGKTWDELVAETYGPCGAETLGYTNHYAQAFAL